MPSVSSTVALDIVAQMFPATPRANLQFHLPFVLKALHDATLTDKPMVLAALATIRAETASFLPIDEFESPLNTTLGGRQPFDKYDYMTQLGNQGPPDGANFKGRGFIQLTGRANYTKFSSVIGLGDQLVQIPDLAGDPGIAARLLAAFLGAEASRIRQALQNNDLATARKLVNGGTNGLADFEDAFRRGLGLIPDPVQVSFT
jgi:peptidoglycan L-alanyl-D-glutamate endopeptidase CwlK